MATATGYQIQKFPTLFGGDKSNLDWVDLSPNELIKATHSSRVRAKYVFELAFAQVEAAKELGLDQQAGGYRVAANFLASLAGA